MRATRNMKVITTENKAATNHTWKLILSIAVEYATFTTNKYYL
jgi:hypothetical protein